MQVTVRFFAIDLPPDLTHFHFDLPENAVLQDAVDACLALPEIEIDAEEFDNSTIMRNGDIIIDMCTPLSDGDTLLVMRVTEGG